MIALLTLLTLGASPSPLLFEAGDHRWVVFGTLFVACGIAVDPALEAPKAP